MLLLAGVLITAAGARDGGRPCLGSRCRSAPGSPWSRSAAIIAIAIPLSSSTMIRQSQEDAQGDLPAALGDAETAVSVEPFAAEPRLQEALVHEELGELGPAAAAAQAATRRESTDWRTWLVLSRLEARRGNAAASVAAYRRARSLNPRSPLFQK